MSVQAEHDALGIALSVVGSMLDGSGDNANRLPIDIKLGVKAAFSAKIDRDMVTALDSIAQAVIVCDLDITVLGDFVAAYREAKDRPAVVDLLPVLDDSSFTFKMERAEEDLAILEASKAWAVACSEYVRTGDLREATFDDLAFALDNDRMPFNTRIDIHAIIDGALSWTKS